MPGSGRLSQAWKKMLRCVQWKPGSGNADDLEAGAVSEDPNSSQLQIFSSPDQLSPLASSSPCSPHSSSSPDQLSPLPSLSPCSPHSSSSSDQVSPLASLSPCSPHSLPTPHPSAARFSWDSVALAVIAIQFGGIIGLVQVAMVKELAAHWLCVPLTAAFCLMTLALLLSLHWLVFGFCLRINGSSHHYILAISLLITALAGVITGGASIRHLLSLSQSLQR